MANINKVTLIGNLTRDPELKSTPKGTMVADLGLAINERWKDANGNEKEDTLFVDITFFGKTAEIIGKHLTKGQPIYVEGKLKLETWDDKQTGQKRSKMKVVGDNFQFLSSGPKSESSKYTRSDANNDPSNVKSYPPSQDPNNDDIPF